MLLLLFLFFLPACFSAKQSYGSLAQEKIVTEFKKMLELLPSINPKTLPDSIKSLRKSVLYTRNLLDIFVYAYPFTSKKDYWRDIRILLNTGYEDIGKFQDLSYVPYTPEEAEELRTPCIQWKEKVFKDLSKYDYLTYLRNPSLLKIFSRENSNLYSFWSDSDTLPDLQYSGIENLSRLTNGLLINLKSQLMGLLTLDDISKPENQIYFHHYRKLIRAIVYLRDNFELFNSNCGDLTYASGSLDKMYDDLGNLNDIYNQYVYYRGQTSKSAQAAAETALESLFDKWTQITHWIKEDNLAGQIECLRSSLIII